MWVRGYVGKYEQRSDSHTIPPSFTPALSERARALANPRLPCAGHQRSKQRQHSPCNQHGQKR